MDNNNENNTSIIPISSTGIVRVSNSLAITQKILNELQQRFDPLAWWQTLDDDMKMALYANIKCGEEIKECFDRGYDYFDKQILDDQLKTVINLGIGAINNLGIGIIKSILQLNLLHIISKFNISDIIPIKVLTNLTHLDLGSNKISDISPLTTLTNLTDLYSLENEISDISPLTSLTNLTSLHLRENEISDIGSLATNKFKIFKFVD
jgi:internalin A